VLTLSLSLRLAVHYIMKKYLARRSSMNFWWRQAWDHAGTTDMLTHTQVLPRLPAAPAALSAPCLLLHSNAFADGRSSAPVALLHLRCAAHLRPAGSMTPQCHLIATCRTHSAPQTNLHTPAARSQASAASSTGFAPTIPTPAPGAHGRWTSPTATRRSAWVCGSTRCAQRLLWCLLNRC